MIIRTKLVTIAAVLATSLPWFGQGLPAGQCQSAASVPSSTTASPRAKPGPQAQRDQEVKLPPGTDPGWWAKVQENIRQDEYTLAWRAEDLARGAKAGWAAFNRAQGFDTVFSETGFAVRPAKDGSCWEWGLSLAAWGWPGAMQAAGKAALHVDKNRVEACREGMGEWFVNDEKGLEQGFSIPAKPESDRRGGALSPPAGGEGTNAREGAEAMREGTVAMREGAEALPYGVVLDLALTGTLRPVISEDGQAVDFYDNGNVGVIHYGQLKATDAAGRDLPVHFEGWTGPLSSSLIPHPSSLISHPSSASAGGIRISIDDTNAAYPITVDPLATSPAWTATGEANHNYLGYSVATAGDVNGDGYSDVVVGAYGASGNATDTGKAYLYLGGPSGLSATPSWTAVGENSYDDFGYSVATAGDVNGDGYSDVVIGAYGYTSASNTGKAYLYLGGPSGLSATASWTKTGENVSSYFGHSVATAGDVNGDGYSDVIVGGDGYNGTGKAYLYLGGPSGLSTTASWTSTGEGGRFGYCVATAGDVNGDGYSDVIVGTYYGEAYLYLGGPSGLSVGAAWTVGLEGGSSLIVATAGDVNGDGYADVILSSKDYSTMRGKANLFLGGPSGLSATPAWTATGEVAYDELGSSVATAGDVNGDGYADVLVGASGYTNSSFTGIAYLYLGGPSGLSATAAWAATGEAASSNFGVCVATAGDVNGDGFSDVIVGGFGYSNLTGKAYLYLGGPSGLSAANSWTAAGGSAGDYLGASVSSAGDVNGDGYGDVIVGAFGYGSGAGKAYLFLGGPAGLATSASWSAMGEAANDSFGRSVSSAGDVNGDGYADVIVGAFGANGNTGKVYLFLGGTAGLSAAPAWTAAGTASTDLYFGYCVAAAGDVNGDGYADVLVGAPYSASAGKAYLFLGGPSGLSAAAAWSTTGESGGDGFGLSLGTAGDVNGDGYSDVIVGAYANGGAAGKAYAFMGGPSGLSATAAWAATGEASGDLYGYCVAAAGDVNGDGYADVIVGAIGNGSSRGKAYMYLGGPSGLAGSACWTAAGEAANDSFGLSVATAGDVNGDGYSDVIVGAPYYSNSQGKAYAFLGGPSGLSATASWTAVGEATNSYLGASVAPAGDVNGDGYADVIAGAYGNSGGTGKAYQYYGGGGPGLARLPRQLRGDGSAPIAPLGRAGDGQFTLALQGRSPLGRGKVKLEWQIAPLGGSYSQILNPAQSGGRWLDTGTAGAALTRSLVLQDGDGPYIWRVRTKYSAATSPFQGHGPWMALAANGPKETDLRRVPACVLPDEPCWLYSVTKSGTAYTLNWEDPNQSNQRTGWNVRRTNNPALAKSSWPVVGSNVVDMDQSTANDQWTDHSGDDPGTGNVWYYEVTTYNLTCPAEGPF